MKNRFSVGLATANLTHSH